VFLEAFGGLQQDILWKILRAQIQESDFVEYDATKFCFVSQKGAKVEQYDGRGDHVHFLAVLR